MIGETISKYAYNSDSVPVLPSKFYSLALSSCDEIAALLNYFFSNLIFFSRTKHLDLLFFPKHQSMLLKVESYRGLV